ncbi:MAG: hypothetical protein GEU28_02365 [Dehalococcoidia bacterium]|nr:hypothetical protein [Dehalococcoidia bacterium]
MGPLTGRKLIELEGVSCAFYGQMLRHLGAEVWKVEPPAGDWARRLAPFVDDHVDTEHSLFWISYNRGKKSLSLDLRSEPGQAVFTQLLGRADFLVSGYAPSFSREVGLDLELLCGEHPSLIVASVTPFGLDVDLGDQPAIDLIVQASSGYMHMTGDPSREPLVVGAGHQAPFHGAMWALVGSLIADYSRVRGGGGALIDASMETALLWPIAPGISQWDSALVDLARLGDRRVVGTESVRLVFRCRDGHVVWFLAGGPAGRVGMTELLQWMDEEGLHSPDLTAIDWPTFDIVTTPRETLLRYEEQFEAFLLTKDRDELLDFALQTGLMMAPVRDFQELLDDVQLTSRGYWSDSTDDKRGIRLRLPEAPMKATERIWEAADAAPRLGEHTSEVLTRELTMSPLEIAALRTNQAV